jgi:hypothetical protein
MDNKRNESNTRGKSPYDESKSALSRKSLMKNKPTVIDDER